MPLEPREQAVELYRSGLNCAQSVAMSLADKVGLDPETIKAVSAPFGGGVARTRSLCGAVTGMLMIIGAAHPEHSKAEIYALSRRAMDLFRERLGSITCADLLKDLNVDSSPTPSPRSEQYYAERPCGNIIATAVDIAIEFCGGETAAK